MGFELANIVPSVISALAGLGGVVAGGIMTTRREEAREQERRSREAAYVATIMSTHLDHFVNGCVATAGDDGTDEGQPAGPDQVEHVPTTQAPEFEPHAATGLDWKSLPPALLDRIYLLPLQIAQLDRELNEIHRVDYDPPDHWPYFSHRRYGYAKLGLSAIQLVRDLRSEVGLSVEFDSIPILDHEHYLTTVMAHVAERLQAIKDARGRSPIIL